MKKWVKWTFATIGLVCLTGAGYIAIQLLYGGNDKIVLLNASKPYTSFREILKRPEFRNKVVYVDVWGTSCLPCFDELKNYTPQLTRRYKDKNDIAFLYICIDRHPLPEVRWKNKIKTFQPCGYHVLVEGEEEARLARDIIGEAAEGQYFAYVPFYLIVNKQGNIVSRVSSNPEAGEMRPSNKDLLYRKLDSLRSL